MRLKHLLLFVALTASSATLAVEPDEMLADPALEARARELSKGLRCVVCQNQDIDSSNAGVARDLRLLVRERLAEGDTDAEVIDYVTARYGDYVLLRPPFSPATYALWFAPGMLALIAAGVGGAVLVRQCRATGPARLSEVEERYIEDMLDHANTEDMP